MNPRLPVDPGVVDVVGIWFAVAVAAGLALAVGQLVLVSGYTRRQRRIIAFAVGTAMLGTLAYGWLLVSSPPWFEVLAGDAGAYHEVIHSLVDEGLAVPPSRFSDRAAFLYLMAAAQWTFGINAFVTVAVNVALVGLVVLLVADTTRLVADTRTATVAAAMVSVLPAVPLWSGPPLREALVVFLTMAFANAAVRLGRQLHLAPLLVGAGILLVMLYTREAQLVSLAAGAVVAIALAIRRILPRFILPWALAGAVGVVLVGSFHLGPTLTRNAWAFSEVAQETYRNLHKDAATAIGPSPEVGPVSPLGTLQALPAKLTRYLWGPFPGEVPPSRAVFYLDAAVWWFATPLAALGAVLVLGRRCYVSLVLLTMAATMAAIGALTLGNYGIVSRMRLGVWLMLIPLVSVGLVGVGNRLRSRSPSP